MIRRAWNMLVEVWREPHQSAPARCAWSTRVLAAATLLLVAGTWPMWTPQDAFPRTPWVAIERGTVDALDRAALPALCLLLLGAALLPLRARRGALLAGCLILVALLLGDQQRFQPWAYQFLLWAVVLAAAPPGRAVALLRLLTVSIYVYSASSKLDASFAQSLGPQIVEALLRPLGLSMVSWSPTAQGAAALFLPLVELFIALGLCVPRLRQVVVVKACIMHLLSIAAFAPWGLNHQPAVLIWNLAFIIQNLILFWPLRSRVEQGPVSLAMGASSPPVRPWGVMAELFVAFALLWPPTEPWGWCDTWPAWGLYATRAERVTVFVHADDVARLPEACRPFVDSTAEGDWRRLSLDRWSLAALRAPIYPQQRFQLSVALAVADRSRLLHPLQIIAAGRAGRFTGRRDETTLWGPAEIRDYARRFWFSTEPLTAPDK